MAKQEFVISGMTCANCASTIEKQVKKLNGVHKAKVSLALNYLKVEGETSLTTEQVIKAVKQAGYEAKYVHDELVHNQFNHEWRSLIIRFAIALFLTSWMWMGMIFMLAAPDNLFGRYLNNPIWQLCLTIIVEFGIGWSFFKDVYAGVRNKKANMAFLVVVGTLAAIGLSIYNATMNNWQAVTHHDMGSALYFETAATIITLVMLGKILEAIAKNKTTNALKSLTQLLPSSAIKLVDGESVEVAIVDVQVGDILVVKPGDAIPLDGIVVKGSSHVNEAMLTGEAKSVKKILGSVVTGATINQEGYLEIKVVKIGANTTLAKIIQLVADAQTSELAIQKIVDKIATWFIPIVFFLAIITFIGWSIYDQQVSQQAWQNAIAVLVIACPCALGLATPTAIMVGTGKAAQHGILFKGGNFLEQMAKLDTIVFDKTGTLTAGEMHVQNFMNFSKNLSDDEIIVLMKTVEHQSKHPIAIAIQQYRPDLDHIALKNIEHFNTVTSYGVQGVINNQLIQIGKSRWFEHMDGFNSTIQAKIEEWEKQGHTVFLISIATCVVGMVTITDPLKPHAKALIEALKEMKINVMLLTGDSALAGEYVAEALGIEHITSDVTVAQKAEVIKALQAQDQLVAMIGDGINDTVALTQANVGISINTGMQMAIDASDVVIMEDNLLQIIGAIKAAKKTVRKIKSNLFWAFIYNIAVLPLAIFGILAPEIAAAVMALQSVSVVTNSLFLKV